MFLAAAAAAVNETNRIRREEVDNKGEKGVWKVVNFSWEDRHSLVVLVVTILLSIDFDGGFGVGSHGWRSVDETA